MNGLEGLAILFAVIVIFLLSGSVIVGPLAILFAYIGGRMKPAALVLGVSACVLGVVGVVVGICASLFLTLDGMSLTGYVLLIGSPLVSILFGVIALRLRGRREKNRLA